MTNKKDGSGSSPKQKKPSKKLTSDDIISFLKSRHGRASKSEIAKKFGVTGNDRIGLKHVLKEMLNRGTLHHGTFRSYVLPEVAKAEALPDRKRDKNTAPSPAFQNGAQENEEDRGPIYFVGLYEPMRHGGGMVHPVSRKDRNAILVSEGRTGKARNGDLVKAIYSPRGWSIESVIAEFDDANMVSLMAIETMDIPHVFPEEAMAETVGITVPELGKRTDLRDLPLVTIDGEDSRDFDDAVHATPDKNGGWKITVAIADVSHYVRPGSALDVEAFARGNSVYFPDRVVPMLPEALSNDLCSLRPHEERACMAAIMRINSDGKLIDTKIVRGLMKSSARLTYTEVQEAFDGNPNDKTKPILDSIIKPLYGAYEVLAKARAARGTVELDLPERKVFIKDGVVQDIVSRARFDSHKLIEEMMILANVAVAEALESKEQEALYRVHPKPDASRWSNTREFLMELGLKTKPAMHPKPQDLQDLLDAVTGRDEAPLVNDMVLRSMSQATYSPEKIGHFGLALESYSHFTSPIRRYADLIVHRALIRAFDLGDDGLTDHELGRLEIIGVHISARERVAQLAERETVDRYIALFLQDKVGATFHARVSGVTKFGLFVNVDPFGADGLIPVRTLPDDFYIHDEKRHSLTGRKRGYSFRLAMRLMVRLVEVEAATGRLLMELMPESIGEPVPHADRPTQERRPPRDGRNPNRNRRGEGPSRRSDGEDRGSRGGFSGGSRGGSGRDFGRDSDRNRRGPRR
jgi:ribonuclease R